MAIVKYRRPNSKSKSLTRVVVQRRIGTRKYFTARGRVRGNVAHKNTVSLGKGLPNKILITHKYEEIVDITSTTGAQQIQRFAANGLYDPNITGVGHQPLYFDQMAALYNHYTVIGAKIRVTFIPKAASNNPVGVGLTINDDTSVAYTSISNMGEQAYGRTAVMAPASNTPFTMTHKWSAKKIFGGRVLANDNLQGSGTANPVELSFFDIVVQAYASATQAVTVRVQLEYLTVWKELKDIAES